MDGFLIVFERKSNPRKSVGRLKVPDINNHTDNFFVKSLAKGCEYCKEVSDLQ